MGIIVAVLFILLLLCFYFIALLNMKMNRFQKNERKNELIFEEMEASISSFLTDIEDENTRLIQSLKKVQDIQQSKEPMFTAPAIKQEVNKVEAVKAPIRAVELEKSATKEDVFIELIKEPIEDKLSNAEPITYSAPKAYVQNAYQTQKKEKPVQTIEERVYDMYARGQTIGAIAKELGKGKVEVELLLKFYNKNT